MELAAFFQWVIGLAVGVLMPIVAWVAFRTHDLSIKVAVLEARPYVDPVEHARALTQMAYAVTQLTQQLADNDIHRTEQITHLREQINHLREEVQAMRESLERQGGHREFSPPTNRR